MKHRIADAPNPQDLPGYDYGVAMAALGHLFTQAQAGRASYYRQPHGDRRWNVWLSDALDLDTGYRGVRLTLDDFVCSFAAGTLPSQQQSQTAGGAA